jgi:hypothetical protein
MATKPTILLYKIIIVLKIVSRLNNSKSPSSRFLFRENQPWSSLLYFRVNNNGFE